MDYEKKYKEALEKARLVLQEKGNEPDGASILSEFFPELVESKDEWIRKMIIEQMKRWHECALKNNVIQDIKDSADAIAWLERQGEQKPIIIIPKFRVGDEIKTTNESPLTITKITDSGYWSEDLFICSFENSAKWELVGKLVDKVEPKFHEGEWITNGDYTWKIVEVKPLDYILQSQDGNIVDDTISHVDEQFHSFTIEDAKDGDVLVASDGSIFLFAGVVGCACKHYVALTTYGDVKFNEGLKHCWENSSAVYPATKEQYDALKKAIADAGYTFDFEKKELKKIEQKPAWSEEDERTYKSIMYSFAHNYQLTIQQQEFVKSLKDRVQPQPKQEWSEEDEKILDGVITNYESGYLPSVEKRDEIIQESFKAGAKWQKTKDESTTEDLGRY